MSERLCRGCGGNGIDQSVPPRTVQLVSGIFYCTKRGTTSNAVCALEIAPVDRQNHARLSAMGPLSYILERIEHYLSIGYVECEHDPEMLKRLACSWCHGTGVPQLSVATMELAVR